MPAVTFVHSTIHNSQNCLVPNAVLTSTLCVVIIACGLAWVSNFPASNLRVAPGW